MATIHTNYLTGNDTTGNGSTATPYKTISKALNVAANNDLVKVAGGELQQVTGLGTVTTTTRGTTIATSQSLTSQFVVGDLIFINTSANDGFPIISNGLVITAITATTITLNTNSACHFKAGTYTEFYKFSAYHYSATVATTTFEVPTTITATTVTVEGGWDATFTTQIGWTAVKANGLGNINFFNAWTNFIKPNIVFNKFIFAGVTGAFNGNTSSIGINEVAFFACTNNTNLIGNSNFGVYAPSSIGYTTIYAYGSAINGSWNGSANKPTTLNLKQWITAASSTTNTQNIKAGYASGEGSTLGTSIKSLEVNWRTLQPFGGTGNWGVIGGSLIGDLYIEKLNMYVGGASISAILQAPPSTDAWRYVEDITVTNIDGSRSGIMPVVGALNTSSLAITADGPLNVNRTSGLLDQLPWMVYGSASASNTVVQAQRSPIFGRDAEGQKVINTDGIPKYADASQYVTGSNSLRFKLVTNTSGADNIRYFCGILSKPDATTTFTLTVKMKASKTISYLGTPMTTELLYGPAFSKFTAFNINQDITTTWQDFTFTVNPTTLTDWNVGNDGLMQILIKIPTGVLTDQTENAYLWVDSVTIL